MVKLKGPGVSADASGTLGNVLTFSKSAKGGYAKKHSTPANPKSARQVSQRAPINFLSFAWPAVNPMFDVDWITLAKPKLITPYNAFVQYNLQMWSQFKFATQRYPGYTFSFNGRITVATATALNRSIAIHLEITSWTQNWGYALFRSTSTGFAPSQANCIFMDFWKFPQPATRDYNDGPLPAGTYYYRVRTFSYYGISTDSMPTEWNATIS